MPKKIITIILILSLSIITLNAQFPYNNQITSGVDFTRPNPTGNASSFSASGLLLTNNTTNKLGTAILDRVFPSLHGIRIEFDYSIYGTNINDGAAGGDGLSFYIYNGDSNLTDLGASGASLGYTYRRNSTITVASGNKGLTDAYLGIALDVWGNFKGRRYQGSPAEYVNGILPTTFNSTSGKSHVTLRGAAGKNPSTPANDYYFGYPVLYTRATNSNTVGSTHLVLNMTDGTYTSFSNGLTNLESLATKTISDSKKIILEVVRNPNITIGGSIITVKFKGDNDEITLINKYHYPTSIQYNENAVLDDNLITINSVMPTNLKVGFTASTGGAVNNHLIKNLKITVPYAAEPTNDVMSVCVNGINSINVTDNDKAYSGTIGIGETGVEPVLLATNIDKNSFSFISSTGLFVGYNMTTTRGEYNYNPITGNVTYKPLLNLSSGNETISYTIKGSAAPYNTDYHRSIGTITTTVSGNGGTITGNNTVIKGKTANYSNTTTGASNPWTSSNTNVFTVSNTGVVTAVNQGTADLLYRTSSGCTIVKSITVVLDSDGDGISDNEDLDNDNDGILDIVEVSNCTNPTIRNILYFQDFGTIMTDGIRFTQFSEAEGRSGLTYKNTSPTSDNHYSLTNNTTIVDDFGTGYNDQWSIVENSPNNQNLLNGYFDHTSGNGGKGLMAIFNPQDNTTEIWRSPIITVKPGAAIELSLWLMRLNITRVGTFLPNLNIQLVNAQNNSNIGSVLNTGDFTNRSVWEQKVITIPKNTNLTARNVYIKITSNVNSGQGNDFALDDIRISELYCDSDSDGIPNHLDTDSDGDGCPDALEGSESVQRNQIHFLNLLPTDPNYPYRGQIKVTYNGTTVGTPANIVSTSPNGLGVPQLVNNAGNNYNTTTNSGNLAGIADNTDNSSEVGQGDISSINSTIKSSACTICYKAANLVGTTLDTKVGISTLGKGSAWPENRKGSFLAIESKSKGLVIPRTLPSLIANPVLGMIIYDTGVNCLKMYSRNNLGVLGWYCMERQSCDETII